MKKKTLRRQKRSNRRTKRMNIKRRNSKKMRRMHGGATTEQIGAAAQMREVIKDYIFKNKGNKIDNNFHISRMNLNRIVHCGHNVQVKKKAHDFYDNREYNYDPYAETIIDNAMDKIMQAPLQEVIPLSPGQQAQLKLAREKALRSNPNPGVPASRSHSHSRSHQPQSQLMPSSRSPPPQSMQGSDSPASSSRFSFISGSPASSSRSSSSSPVPPSALTIDDLQSNDQFPVLQSSRKSSPTPPSSRKSSPTPPSSQKSSPTPQSSQ